MPDDPTRDPGAEILGEAVKAAKAVFTKHGMPCPAVVVNVAWRDADVDYAMGSTVPRSYREIMGDSLEASAEEARDV